MRVQKAKGGVRYFGDARDLDEERRRACGLLLAGSLTGRATGVGRAGTSWGGVGSDEKRVDA